MTLVDIAVVMVVAAGGAATAPVLAVLPDAAPMVRDLTTEVAALVEARCHRYCLRAGENLVNSSQYRLSQDGGRRTPHRRPAMRDLSSDQGVDAVCHRCELGVQCSTWIPAGEAIAEPYNFRRSRCDSRSKLRRQRSSPTQQPHERTVLWMW